MFPVQQDVEGKTKPALRLSPNKRLTHGLHQTQLCSASTRLGQTASEHFTATSTEPSNNQDDP